MATRRVPPFQHRNNPDGTCDSICLRCFRTITSTPFLPMLLYAESTHTCSAMDLHFWIPDRITYRS
jgi:hypothetical protein